MLCSKAVKWGQRALACDSCDKWCHVSCMAMSTADYDQLANSSATWICSSCNTPNFSKLYDSISVDNNSFECLSSVSMDSSALSSPTSTTIGSPSATSSPKRPSAPNSRSPRRELRTIIVNFQSIKNKVPETQVLIDSADPDIIVGSETWLNSNVFSSEVLPANYNVFRRDRTDGYDGVLIAVKDDLVSTPIHTSSDSELISVKIKCDKSKSVIISSFYRPPTATSEEQTEQIIEELTKRRLDNEKCDFWIGGDFNLPDIDWPSLTVNSHQYPVSMSNRYLSIPSQCGVDQVVEAPTRGNKTLDLFFTNNPSLVDKCKPIPGVGDHDAILIDTLIRPRRVKPTKRKIHLWDKKGLKQISSFFLILEHCGNSKLG